MPDFLTPADIDWTEAGAPVSRTFGDVYFSREDGLAETRAVFLAGCGLPHAWADRRHFTVGELGFGTGLNILALLDLWTRSRPPNGRLHIWTVEAHPIGRDAAAAAHAAWPELARLSAALLERWPRLTPGLHRIDLPELHATIDLALGDAAAMLDQWSGRADAWFLDGFAPSSNPAMWSGEVLQRVAARSAPGARLATFTVAGHVRRGLAAHGFTVEKRPGHGRKRERLEAVFPGAQPACPPPPRVAVVGGGIAGAAVVRALRTVGAEPVLIEASHAGAGASGAPAALVTPWVDAGLSPAAVLAAQAFLRAGQLYRSEVPDAVIGTGVIRVPRDDADLQRWLRVAGQPIWPAGSISELDAADVAGLTGEALGPDGIWMSEALVLEPAAVLGAWLTGTPTIRGSVVELTPGETVEVRMEDGSRHTFDHVVITAGWGSAALGVERLSPVRGQLFWAEGVDPGRPAIWGPGYAIPTRSGALVGATHDRGRTDVGVSEEDTTALLSKLSAPRPGLAARLGEVRLEARAAVRATTPDHRPVCGAVGQGVWTLTGLGGRGFAWAPLLGEHLAALISATPSPVSVGHHPLVAPARYGVPAVLTHSAMRAEVD